MIIAMEMIITGYIIYRDEDDDDKSGCKLFSSVLAEKISTMSLIFTMMMMTISSTKSVNLLVDELSSSVWHHLRHSPRHHVAPLLAAPALPQSQLGNLLL